MRNCRDRLLLFYMMRVPLLFLLVLGVLLPVAFGSSMFHGIADLTLIQVFEASFLASLLVSSAMTASYLVLLYGLERADGWAPRPAPEQRVSLVSVTLLYLYGAACWVSFLYSILNFMKQAGRVTSGLVGGFLLYAAAGLVVGGCVVMIAFLVALRSAKPADDDALEVFAFPAFLVIRRVFNIQWIRRFKEGTRSTAALGSFAAHDGPISRLVARLGPGYGLNPAQHPGPPALHSGHRFAAIVTAIFLLLYWLSGQKTYGDLHSFAQWAPGGASNNVLNYLLFFFIFWNCVLSGLTFFVDRYRIPALAALGAALFLISCIGHSDHTFPTFERHAQAGELRTPQKAFDLAPQSVVVVAAAGGGIQSAAWTSKVLCGLRADLEKERFQNGVLAISGVSGGSVGALFYLRCLEPFPQNDPPDVRARDSSLGAIAWGLTHPDLRRIFIPGPSTSWSRADRGWALERSILKSANFAEPWRGLTENRPGWPIMLFNSTDAQTGDPVVFSNGSFEIRSNAKHSLQPFLQQQQNQHIDVSALTAARMSAAFPYVSPEARPQQVADGVHLGDGGYFDNSGVFALSEWLKQATPSQGTKQQGPQRRILLLQLDAFPDSQPPDQQKAQNWFYQLYSPITTMLKVRSEGQVVRDEAAGKDLQSILNANGYETGWMLIRFEPSAVNSAHAGTGCPTAPPLSWHLTPTEQKCIDLDWTDIESQVDRQVSQFLQGAVHYSDGVCMSESDSTPGVAARFCPPNSYQASK